VLVRIALGEAPISACPAGNVCGDGEITVVEILQAVNAALTGCPVASSQPPCPSFPSVHRR
jgi:hypothetical protein